MKNLYAQLLAVPLILAVAGCSLTGGGNPTTGSIGGGGSGGGGTGGGGGGGTITSGTAASAVLVYAGRTATVIGSGLVTADFEHDPQTALVYNLNGPVAGVEGDSIDIPVNGVEIPYEADHQHRHGDQGDAYQRTWLSFFDIPPRPPQAIDGVGGEESVYVYRAIDDIAPEHVTIARSVREVISVMPDTPYRTYVGYHVTGEVTETMPTDVTLSYEGRLRAHKSTYSGDNPKGGASSGERLGAVSMQATLANGGGTVAGTLDVEGGFQIGRTTTIGFEGDVAGATFDARQITVSPGNSAEIVSIKDTSAVQGAFFGDNAKEVGGVFLVEGQWNNGFSEAPYHFAGAFVGKQADE